MEEGEEEEEDFEEDEEEELWQQQQQQRQQRQQRRRPSPAFGPLYSLSDDFQPSSSPQGVADASEDPSWLDSRSRLAFAGSVLGGSSSSASPSSSRPSSSAPPPPPPRRPRLESMQGLPLDAQERGAVEGLLSAFAGALDDGDFVRPVSPRPSSSSSSAASASERDEFGNRAARLELCPGADPGVAELTSRLLPLASAASDVARFAHVSRRRRAGGVSAGAGGEAAKVLCEWRRHVARVEHASLSTACGRGGVGGGGATRRAGMGLQQLSLAFSADFPAVAALLEMSAAAREAAARSATGGELLDLLARRSAAARGDPPRAAAAASLLSAAAAPYFAALHSWVTRGELAGGSKSARSGGEEEDEDEHDDEFPNGGGGNELPILEDPSVLPGDVAPDGSDAFWTRKYTLRLREAGGAGDGGGSVVDAPACLGAEAAESALAAGRAVAALRVILSSSSPAPSSASASSSSSSSLLFGFCPLPAGTRIEYDAAGTFRRTLAAAARRASAALLEAMTTGDAGRPLLPLSLPAALRAARRFLLLERGDVALALADVAAEGLWSEGGLGGSSGGGGSGGGGGGARGSTDPPCFLPLSSVPASSLAARGPRARGALLERALSACGCSGDAAAALPLRLRLDGRSLLNMLRDLREGQARKANASSAAPLERSRRKEKRAAAQLLLRSRSAAEALSLSLRAPWPLSIVVPRSAADTYAALARHVSDLGCAEARLAGAWLALAKPLRRAGGARRGRGGSADPPPCSSSPPCSPSSAPPLLLSRILFQRSCVAAALRALHAHAVDDVLSPALRQLRSDLRERERENGSLSLASSPSALTAEEAAAAHARFLDAAARGVLLCRRPKLLRAVGEIKASASVLSGAVEALVAEAAVFGGEEEGTADRGGGGVAARSPPCRGGRRRSSFGAPSASMTPGSSSSSRRASVGGLAIDASPMASLLDGGPCPSSSAAAAAAAAATGNAGAGGGYDSTDGGAAARACPPGVACALRHHCLRAASFAPSLT